MRNVIPPRATARRPRTSGRLRIVATVAMSVLGAPRAGLAHTPGLSTADFSVLPSGRVEGRLTFASAEPLGTLALGGGDGVVTAAGVSAANMGLQAFVLDGIDVTADGERCAARFEGAALTEIDGLTLRAAYACPSRARYVEATLYFLSELPEGHREIARISAGGRSTEAVLTARQRAVGIELPAERSLGRPPPPVVPLAVAAMTIAAAVAALIRLRTSRTEGTERRSRIANTRRKADP